MIPSASFASRTMVQAAVVMALIAILTVVIALMNFRSVWNLAWIVGIPFAVAKAFDRDEGTWFLAGLWLMLCSLGALVATAAILGFGP